MLFASLETWSLGVAQLGTREVPWSSSDVLLMPALFSVIAAMAYGFAMVAYKNTGELPKWRFLAQLLAILAFVFGFPYFWKYVNPSTEGHAYRQLISTRTFQLSHYLAVLGPILVLIVLVLIDMRVRKHAAENA
jgi:hypothetical protein